MSPTNLLTKDYYSGIVKAMDPKMVDSVTNTLLRAIQENSPFYFYLNQQTVEAKMAPGGVLTVTRVKGAHTIKFLMEKINRNVVQHCAKRAIEVLS